MAGTKGTVKQYQRMAQRQDKQYGQTQYQQMAKRKDEQYSQMTQNAKEYVKKNPDRLFQRNEEEPRVQDKNAGYAAISRIGEKQKRTERQKERLSNVMSEANRKRQPSKMSTRERIEKAFRK